MFIKQAFNYQHSFWRYILGVSIIILAVFIGQIPLAVAMFMEGGMDIVGMEENEMLKILDSNLNLFLLLLTFAVGLFALFFVVKFIHYQPIRTVTTSRKKSRLEQIFLWIWIGGNFLYCSYRFRLFFQSAGLCS